MNYKSVIVQLNGGADFVADLAADALAACGYEAFEETSGGIVAYCTATNYDAEATNHAIDTLKQYAPISYTVTDIPDRNWNTLWEQHSYRPICIDNRCVVHDSNSPIADHWQYDIIVNPQQAFGSGTHATTQLMIRSLLQCDLHDKHILDIGTGTGVLAVLAEKTGAAHVLAIDIDEWAYRNAQDTLRRNNTKRIEVRLGGVETVQGKLFDVILANINLNTLLTQMSTYATLLRSNGCLIMSGFYAEDLSQLIAEAEKYNLHCIRHDAEAQWTVAQFSPTKSTTK